MKPVKSYAYETYKTPMQFVNEVFYEDPAFLSVPTSMDNMIKVIKNIDHGDFPRLKVQKEYLGFTNGVFNTETIEFTAEEDITNQITVRKYFNLKFTGSMDTPYIDKIIDFQFSEEVKNFLYASLGRTLSVRDSLGYMPYLLGEAGCGKSVIMNVWKAVFVSVGCINDSFEGKYGLSYLYDKDLIMCDDLPRNLSRVLPQQTFQTMVTGGKFLSILTIRNVEYCSEKW